MTQQISKNTKITKKSISGVARVTSPNRARLKKRKIVKNIDIGPNNSCYRKQSPEAIGKIEENEVVRIFARIYVFSEDVGSSTEGGRGVW